MKRIVGSLDAQPASRIWSPSSGSLTSKQFFRVGRDCIKDFVAGAVAAIILIGNIVSFGALMFPGALSPGIPIAIWAMLIGSCIGGVWIAASTSLPPIASSIDSPTGAVLVVLSASVGADVLAAGGTPAVAGQTIMFFFSAATVLSGVLLYCLGKADCGAYFRFVPYFVLGGFTAAIGWSLIAGGIGMASGHALSFTGIAADWSPGQAVKLAAAVAVLAILLGVRRWVRWPFAIPLALLVMWTVGAFVLKAFGQNSAAQGFYLTSLGALLPWSPFDAARGLQMSRSLLPTLVPELLAVAVVALLSLVTKVSSIEVATQQSGDLNREFRAHGIANLLAAPFGGLAASLQVGTSRLLEQAGGASRMSGVFCALVLGAVGLSHFDLPGFIPMPIIAGLVFYLGYTFIVDAFWRPLSQRAWPDLALVVAMMTICVQYGFLVGIVVGLISACVLFAVSYARRGVVRRHLSRAEFASYVDRQAGAASYLRDHGAAIQLYWLSGYIFFGSSESVFERVKRDIEANRGVVRFVVLDFRTVTGADTSAVMSFTKLRNFCNQHEVAIVYCALSPANQAVLEAGGLVGPKGRHKIFTDLPHSLAWCEDELLAGSGLDRSHREDEFAPWLQGALGHRTDVGDLLAYLERKVVERSEVLYQQGEPANTIDIIAAGHLVVDIRRPDGSSVRVRRIMTYGVVGEMGFFRLAARAATVSSDGPATLFTLTRRNFERMRAERPGLAAAFDDFIFRVLADRVDFANRAVVALSK